MRPLPRFSKICAALLGLQASTALLAADLASVDQAKLRAAVAKSFAGNAELTSKGLAPDVSELSYTPGPNPDAAAVNWTYHTPKAKGMSDDLKQGVTGLLNNVLSTALSQGLQVDPAVANQVASKATI